MSHAPTGTLSLRHRRIRQALSRSRRSSALVVTALPNIALPDQLHRQRGDRRADGGPRGVRHRLPVRDNGRDRAGVRGGMSDLELSVVDGSYDATLAARAARRRVGSGRRLRSGASHRQPAPVAGRRTRRCRTRHRASCRRPGSSSARASVKDAYELEALREGGAASVDCRQGGLRGGASRAHRAGGRACHRLARARRRVRAHRLRDDRRQRTERRAAAREADGAKINRRRPGGAGLRRRLRLILRGPYPDRGARTGVRARREVHAAVPRPRAGICERSGRASRGLPIDAAARRRCATAGMAEAFGHGTGHGLGHRNARRSADRPPAARTSDLATNTLAPAWYSRSSPARTSRAGAACGSKTMCWSPSTGVELLTDVTTELLEL